MTFCFETIIGYFKYIIYISYFLKITKKLKSIPHVSMQCWNNRGGNSPIFDEKTNDGKRTVEKIQIQESEHEQGRDDRHTYKVPEEDSAREKNHQQENVLFSQKRWIGVNSFPVVDCEWSKKRPRIL